MSMSDASELVPKMLDEYGRAAQNAMLSYLGPHGARNQLAELVADYPTRGGRNLRASLCLASARMFGASIEDALPTAVALEMMHNAFLIHDDVEDESEERRGAPTLNALHGVPIAVNVGDALIALSLQPLLANRATLGPRLAFRIVEETDKMARESVEGQALELSWRRENVFDLDDRDYLCMVLKKTCWYTTIYPLRIGALIGSRDGAILDHYVRFGFLLGAAFQIQDDILNLVGNPARYGKEIEGDLWEAKRTLMLIRLFRSVPGRERNWLRTALGTSRRARTATQVRRIRRGIDEHRCIEYAQEFARGLAGAALQEFSHLFAHLPESREKRFVGALPQWALERT